MNRKKFLRGDFLLPIHPIKASNGMPRSAAKDTALDLLSRASVVVAKEI
jgi:hypothetical protein